MDVTSAIDGLGQKDCQLRTLLFSLTYQEDVQTPLRPSPLDTILFLVRLEKAMKLKYAYNNPPRNRCNMFIRNSVINAYPAFLNDFKKGGSGQQVERYTLPLTAHMDELLSYTLKAVWHYDTKSNPVATISLHPNNNLRAHLISETHDGFASLCLPLPSVTLAEGWTYTALDKWVGELQLSMAMLHLESHIMHFHKVATGCQWNGKMASAPKTVEELSASVICWIGKWWKVNWVERLRGRFSSESRGETATLTQVPTTGSNKRNRAVHNVPPMDGSSHILLMPHALHNFQDMATSSETSGTCRVARALHIAEADVHRCTKMPRRTLVQASHVRSPLAAV